MAESWKEFSLYRRVLLAVMLVLVLGFGIATPVVGIRKGIEYQDEFLLLTEENGLQKYSGKVEGKRAEFTVHPDGAITYRWGDYNYGPYQVVEDPTAAPRGMSGSPGVEIRREDEVLFRGTYYGGSPFWTLVDESGEQMTQWGLIGVGTSSGTIWYQDGQKISEFEVYEPSLSVLLRLHLGPELTHRGNLGFYLLVTLLAAFNIFQICCPDFMFQLSLLGRVRDPELAEPSDWYIAMERIEWAVLTAVAAWLYWLALTVIN